MAITNTFTGHGTDTNPPGAVTVSVAVNGNGGVGSDAIVVAMFIGGSSSANATISDNKNTGNYKQIANLVDGNGSVMLIWFMVQQSNVAANGLVITPANTAGNQGQIYVATFTGFTGIPTADSTLGEVDNNLASGQAANTNLSVFTTQTTSFANEIAISVNDTFNTQVKGSPVPNDGAGHNWTDFSTFGICYFHVISTIGQPFKFQFQLQAATTGTTYYQLAAIYDAPIAFGQVIQSTSFNDTSIVTSRSLTFSSLVLPGDTLFAAMCLLNGATLPSVKDSLNGNWQTFDVNGGGAGPLVYIFSQPNSLGGACTVTLTVGTAGAAAWWIGEVAGIKPGRSIVDQIGSNTVGTSSGTLSVFVQKITTYAAEFLLCAAGYTVSTTPTAAFGFTLDTNGNVGRLAVGFQVTTAPLLWEGGFFVSPNVPDYTALIGSYVPPILTPVGVMTPCLAQSIAQ